MKLAGIQCETLLHFVVKKFRMVETLRFEIAELNIRSNYSTNRRQTC